MPCDPEKQRAAKRRYYERNKHVYFEKNYRKRERMRKMMREFKSVPCADCGRQYAYYIMDFDHREGKKYQVGEVVNYQSWKKLFAEMAKCDVVCANCHRFRTWGHLDGSNDRSTVKLRERLPGRSIGRSPRSGRGSWKFESSPGSHQPALF